MEIKLSPRWIAIGLALAIASLLIVHCCLQCYRFLSGESPGIVWFFSLGSDGNIPTYYSSIAILLCSALLIFLGIGDLREKKIPAAYWFGMAVIFIFLSVDEMLMLHERMIEPIRGALNVAGAFYYAWVIPYGIALVLFLIVYARFLLLLAWRTRTLFVVAGAIYVSGAIGFEMLGGMQSEAYGNANVTYVVLQTVEEIMEMVGIALFIFALTDYGDKRYGGLRLAVGS